MAKSIGLIKFSGTIGGITGVNSKEGYYLREKAEIPKSTYANSPSYADFRENGKVWGESSRLRRSFLNGFKLFTLGCSNPRMYSRMTGVMGRIIKSDTVSRKGEFKAANGIETQKGRGMLDGFEFNRDCSLSSVLHETYETDRSTGIIRIDGFVAKKWIKKPKGATHVVLQAGVYQYDFSDGASTFKESERFTFEVGSKEEQDLVFNVGVPTGTGTVVFLLKVLFFQQVNGKLYALNGVKGGCMKIIDVVGSADRTAVAMKNTNSYWTTDTCNSGVDKIGFWSMDSTFGTTNKDEVVNEVPNTTIRAYPYLFDFKTIDSIAPLFFIAGDDPEFIDCYGT